MEALPGGATRLRQLALFAPRGLWGRAYWYLLAPFHLFIFGRLCRRLAEAAEAAPSTPRAPVGAPAR